LIMKESDTAEASSFSYLITTLLLDGCFLSFFCYLDGAKFGAVDIALGYYKSIAKALVSSKAF